MSTLLFPAVKFPGLQIALLCLKDFNHHFCVNFPDLVKGLCEEQDGLKCESIADQLLDFSQTLLRRNRESQPEPSEQSQVSLSFLNIPWPDFGFLNDVSS